MMAIGGGEARAETRCGKAAATSAKTKPEEPACARGARYGEKYYDEWCRLLKPLRGTCGGKCASSCDFGRGIWRIIGGASAEARSSTSHDSMHIFRHKSL